MPPSPDDTALAQGMDQALVARITKAGRGLLIVAALPAIILLIVVVSGGASMMGPVLIGGGVACVVLAGLGALTLARNWLGPLIGGVVTGLYVVAAVYGFFFGSGDASAVVLLLIAAMATAAHWLVRLGLETKKASRAQLGLPD